MPPRVSKELETDVRFLKKRAQIRVNSEHAIEEKFSDA